MIILVMVIIVIFSIQSTGIFSNASKVKVRRDIGSVASNFRAVVGDGNLLADTNGWTTSLDLTKWQVVGTQIIQNLPLHPLYPYEQYHYRISTDGNGSKKIAIWGRYNKKGTTIYCSNSNQQNLADSGFSSDEKASLACEKN